MASGHWHQPVPELPTRQVIAIGSAHPGAGKSVVASNLAAAIAGLGKRVVLVDLDLRKPRQHTLLGVMAKPQMLDAWLDERRRTRDAMPVSTRVKNLRILPYVGASDGDVRKRRAVVDAFVDLDGDVVVVDLGSDNRDDLYDFFASGALRILVTSLDRPALEATFALLKAAQLRAERRDGASAPTTLAQFSGGLIGNLVESPEEAEKFHAFSRLVREHLGIPLPVAGCLRSSERIPQSIAANLPLVARRGLDDNVRAFHQMAEWVVASAADPPRLCDLAGEAISVPPAPLPADLSSYARRFPRFPVDWAATLELPDGATAVRVRDLSASGAAVEASLTLRVGDRAILHFDQIWGQPALPVVVKNILPALRRVGLGFTTSGESVSRLVAAAARLSTTP